MFQTGRPLPVKYRKGIRHVMLFVEQMFVRQADNGEMGGQGGGNENYQPGIFPLV